MLQISDILQQGYSLVTYLLIGDEANQEEPSTSSRQEIKKISKENIPPSQTNRGNTKPIKGKKISPVPPRKRNIKDKQESSTIKISEVQDEQMAAFFVQCMAAQGYIDPAKCFEKSACPAPSDNNPKATEPSTDSKLSKMSVKGDICRVKAMDKMPEVEKRPTQEVYQNLIQFNIKTSQLEHAYDLLVEMQTHHLPIDRLVCHALLDAFAKQKNIQKMEALFEKMKKEGNINEVTYNILIHGYCKDKQLQRALECITEMKANRLRPTIITYNTLLTAYNEHGMIEQMSHLLDEMKQKQVLFNRVTYNIVIDAYMAANNLKKSSKLFKQSQISLIVTYEKKLVLLDCHTLSRGLACIGLHHYLKDHMTIRRFCVITGIGKHSKNAKMYQMYDSIKTFLSKFYPYFSSYTEFNLGRLYCERIG